MRLHLLGSHIAVTALGDQPEGVARFEVKNHSSDDIEYALAEWELNLW